MKPSINFKFEKFQSPKNKLNLSESYFISKDKISNLMMDDQKGFRNSQVVDFIMYDHINNPNLQTTVSFESIDSDSENPYIIPVAVHYHPLDWTDANEAGRKIEGKTSVFERINSKYLEDLRNRRALILIDQSAEGYSIAWLWEWFHKKCNDYNLDPACIIYATGDQKCQDSYDEWCAINKPTSKIKVVSSITLSMYIYRHCEKFNIKSNFKELLEYKKNNKDHLYLYDCTNMRPRPQRVLNFLHLLNAGLLDRGNISMPASKEWYLQVNDQWIPKAKLPNDIFKKITPSMTPRTAIHSHATPSTHYYEFVERVLTDLYMNSWVSLITESSYFEKECSVFISEKTFKPIAAMQPFIVLGSKDTLKYLRKLGYKSFHPYIDESYDTMSDEDRFSAVINAIQKIEQIEDKVAWYESIRHIVEHNYNLFMKTGQQSSIEHTEIVNYYFNYFGEKNV